MKQVGLECVFVDTGLTQTDAIKMYKRFGFTIEEDKIAGLKL
jgi:hypothetical protein